MMVGGLTNLPTDGPTKARPKNDGVKGIKFGEARLSWACHVRSD